MNMFSRKFCTETSRKCTACVGLIILCHLTLTSSSEVAFYESTNYMGLIIESSSNQSCMNLPRRAYDKSQSLTTSSCLILYKGENCTMTSIKVTAGAFPDLNNVTHEYGENFGNAVRSFHQCNEHIGSSDTVHVSLYQEDEMIVEYKNICGCITLPEITNSITRLDNHGTCMKLYVAPYGIEPSCTGNYIPLLGGASYISQNLRNITHSGSSWKRIMAISPCSSELTKCIELEATVIKFEVDVDPVVVSAESSSSDISMSITTTFRNNGSAIVTEEYTAKKSIIEVSETHLVQGYSSMQNWSVESGVTTEFSADIPLVAKSTVTTSLSSAYTKQENSSWQMDELKRIETTREFSVSQKIEIKPCSLYNVNSYVKIVHNYPVNYKLLMKVSGIIGERKLTAKEIRGRLEKLDYVCDYDNYTVIAEAAGIMHVDYGMETVIDGEGVSLQDCYPENSVFAESNYKQREFHLHGEQISSSTEFLPTASIIFAINLIEFILFFNQSYT